MKILELNNIEYQDAWDIQKQLFKQAIENKSNNLLNENTLIFCEHPPVYTLGKSGDETNFLMTKEMLCAEIFRIERGGDVTFHGLGQLVGYPIFDLETLYLGCF